MPGYLYTQLIQVLNARQSAVLVTIVSTQGSTPCKPGSKMLVGTHGRISGTIGGGTLEKQAEETAFSLLKKNKSALFPFVLREQGAHSTGMACGGEAMVLFQYISCSNSQWLLCAEAAEAARQSGKGGWILSREDGELALFWPVDTPCPEQFPASLAEQLRPRTSLFAGHWLAEPVTERNRVVIFGAGHIAQSLVPILDAVDFRTVVFDNRREYAVPESFPRAERVICGDYCRLSAHLSIEQEDYIVILTHGHEFDYAVQAQVMRGPYAYLGVIGSSKKTEKLNTLLIQAGFTAEQLESIHTPIGLPILAQTPSEIAVSIASELILVRARRRKAISV